MKTLNNYISERLNPKNLGSADILPEKLKEKYKLTYNSKTCRYDCNDDITVQDDLIDDKGHFICNFGVVKGYFNCSECNNLTSLEGAPKEVDRWFSCRSCGKLESLKGAPKKVEGSFFCNYCLGLKTLEGAPEKVGGWFDCSNCLKLKTLEGAPKEVSEIFDCRECKDLESLEGAPEEVGGWFDCRYCPKLKDYDINTKIGGDLYK